ncbi:membrane protein insertion efficiency factor YidD [Anoxynatronum sibiricum]
MGTKGMIYLIKAYQRWISPLKGQTCRFHPTCSAYSLTAYERFGFWKGTGLMIRRIAKCHPFHAGGVDHVPEKENRHTENEL